MQKPERNITATHWGHYVVSKNENGIFSVAPSPKDSNPSKIGESLQDLLDEDCRIPQPMVREGYLRGDANNQKERGKDTFVPVSWETALDLAAAALKKTCTEHGNEAIYGGSYGWSSAGRFHHAQSQIHRFLNGLGGYTASVNTYSAAACEVIMPHVLGGMQQGGGATYEDIVEHTDLMVSFGGLCLHNNQVVPGGVGDHKDRSAMMRVAEAGVELVNVSPIKDDIPSFMTAQWLPLRPNTDVAIMLALAYELETQGKVDRGFLESYTVGYERFRKYLMGENDGCPKDPEWASDIAGISSENIRELAKKMANSQRTLITISLSLQRTEHGEQPYWMATTLAAMLGHIGLKGGGIGYAWGSNGRGLYGRYPVPFSWGRLEQGKNPTQSFIPVARITDMLLHPNQKYQYNGQTRTYPDIKLVYWAGGNPFHHHQDLNRLRLAWQKPDCIIVNESAWTATARHADIVFPTASVIERNDISCGQDLYITPSKKSTAPFRQSLTDYEIFSALSDRLGFGDSFTENRSEMDWLINIYNQSQINAQNVGITLPDFEEFWESDGICLEGQVAPTEFVIERFRQAPSANPLNTPSGKIELFSEVIDRFGYEDCPGHPMWLEKKEWLGSPRATMYPLHLISSQPKTKLHSQLDYGRVSRNNKIQEREPVKINPADADTRGISNGDIVRLFNDRGACLAGAIVTQEVRPSVLQLPTGAWFDPQDEGEHAGLERHGNPNVLTLDQGTSQLAQGPSAHSCLVEIELFTHKPPKVQSFTPPKMVTPSK